MKPRLFSVSMIRKSLSAMGPAAFSTKLLFTSSNHLSCMNRSLNSPVLLLVIAVSLCVAAQGFAGRIGRVASDGTDRPTSIQSQIDAASDGDIILLEKGRFDGPIDFRGKRITIRGVGPETVLVGPSDGSAVRFTSGEGRGSVLESLTVTGGSAVNGGGIHVTNAAPTLQRLVIFNNRASGLGAGLYVGGGKALPLVRNNIFAYNDDTTPELTEDAHQIFVDTGASAVILNNTIVRGNGNGILVQPSPRQSEIRNNLIAWNGSRLRSGAVIGRGICDFSGSAVIRHNLFFANSKAAVITGTFVDFDLARDAEIAVAEPRFRENLDADPKLRQEPPVRTPARFVARDFTLRATSPARNAGAEERRHRDRNGSRNDIGHAGGTLGW